MTRTMLALFLLALTGCAEDRSADDTGYDTDRPDQDWRLACEPRGRCLPPRVE